MAMPKGRAEAVCIFSVQSCLENVSISYMPLFIYEVFIIPPPKTHTKCKIFKIALQKELENIPS